MIYPYTHDARAKRAKCRSAVVRVENEQRRKEWREKVASHSATDETDEKRLNEKCILHHATYDNELIKIIRGFVHCQNDNKWTKCFRYACDDVHCVQSGAKCVLSTLSAACFSKRKADQALRRKEYSFRFPPQLSGEVNCGDWRRWQFFITSI